MFISIESIRMINNAKTNMTIFFISFHINLKLKFSSLPFVYFFVFVISYQSMMSIKYWTENTYEQIEFNVDPRFCLLILFLDFNYVIHPSENHFRFHLRAGGKPYINFFSFSPIYLYAFGYNIGCWSLNSTMAILFVMNKMKIEM